MLECTQRVIHAILYAHQNATGLGSPEIEPEHLLIGLLQETTLGEASWALLVRHKDWLRDQIYIHAPIGNRLTPLNEMRWSSTALRVLEYGVEEATRLSDKRVGLEHLLLGLLREQDCFAAKLLNKRGVDLETTRAAIASQSRDQEEPRYARSAPSV